MNEQRFPPRWNEQRVKELIAELDARTEEEWIAADEAAALGGEDQTVVTVPTALLPEIRKLLAALSPRLSEGSGSEKGPIRERSTIGQEEAGGKVYRAGFP